MRFSSSFVALAAPFLVSALPMRRQSSPADATDLLVLNFANVLEQLETQFYSQALQKFQSSDFTGAGFTSGDLAIEQFTSIQSDESTHATVLASVINSLGGQTISGCQFDFSSVLTDVPTFAAAARLVENVGVGAYLGAAHLLSDPSLLTAAASIVTIEARHQSILNILSGTGSAIPQAFDIPLTPSQVLAIAGGFISGCDTGIPANAALSVTNSGAIKAGDQLSFSSSAIGNNIDPTTLTCQMIIGGEAFSLSQNFTSCLVPPGVNGPVAVFVTNNSQPLLNNVVTQFAGNVVAGPTILFVDSETDVLSQLARNTGNTTSTSTSEISPAQASQIASSSSSSSSSDGSDSSSPSNSNPQGSSNGTSSDSGSSSSNGTDSSNSIDSSSNSTSINGTDGTSINGTDSSDSTSIDGSDSSNSTSISGNSTGVAGAVSSGSAVGTNNAASVGGPNLYTGVSPTGTFLILGWQDLPQGSP